MTTIFVRDVGQSLPPRRRAEFYPTEPDLVRAALAAITPPADVCHILDVGAGDGRWGREAKRRYPAAHLTGVELRPLAVPPEFDTWHIGDVTGWQSEQHFDLIIGNPPYGDGYKPSLAERIIRHSWTLLAPGGTLAFLLRLSFQAGVERSRGLWCDLPPVEVLVCSRRPSFYGGGTNGTDYGVYVWRKDDFGQPMGQSGAWMTRLLLHERNACA